MRWRSWRGCRRKAREDGRRLRGAHRDGPFHLQPSEQKTFINGEALTGLEVRKGAHWSGGGKNRLGRSVSDQDGILFLGEALTGLEVLTSE